MIFTQREQSQRASDDALERNDRWRRWARYKEMDLKNFRQGGEYPAKVKQQIVKALNEKPIQR